MNLQKLFLTKNNCYKAGRTITPKGIMVHSTGANNPKLSRYVGPDDGLLGVNPYGNHWNTPLPGGGERCVHAFIGKLADGSIATYQTLPWTYRGWHAGGKANDTHIGFEICEDGLMDPAYFKSIFREAAELCAHLCKEYGLTGNDIIDHSEGYKQGIASNHGDVGHWFPKHGESMDTFRAAVQSLISNKKEDETMAIKAGDTVKITGANAVYTNGKTVPASVKNKNMTVQQVNGDKLLIQEIVSWVYAKDCTLVTAAAPPAPAPAETVSKEKYDKVVAERNFYQAEANAAQNKLDQVYNIVK